MQVLLIPIGSHGDVHPLVGLGLALQARGHAVTIYTNPHFEGLVRGVGLDYLALGTEEIFQEATQAAGLWDPVEGFKVVSRFTLSGIEPVFEQIAAWYRPGESLVVAPVTGFGARIAQEVLGVPLVTVDLQPVILRSVIAPAELPGAAFLRHLPRWGRRAFYRFADWLVIDPILAPQINAFRARHGLKPARRILNWWHSPQGILGLFPEWFAAPQADWPGPHALAGFPLYDERESRVLDAQLEAFLSAGQPPVAFTPGSAMRQGESFFAAAIDACQRLDRRGLLVTRFTEHLPAGLPEGIRHVAYAPFSLLLPRCAALVHHGGIGTTSQALAAGIPQVVMPLAHDQPDNAWRVESLGVGRQLEPKRFRGPELARVLGGLLADPEVPGSCRAVAGRFAGADALGKACAALEAFHRAAAGDRGGLPVAAG
jgi:UDP:flavonoid glycosyltransferase YjiC (YdhE family)